MFKNVFDSIDHDNLESKMFLKIDFKLFYEYIFLIYSIRFNRRNDNSERIIKLKNSIKLP